MKGKLLIILKVFGGLTAFCLSMVAGAVFLLNTDAFQNKLLHRATRLLSEKLQTRVEIDSISIGLFSQDVNLYGLDVEDLQQRKMLQLDHLSVSVSLWPLLRREVCITNAAVDGVRAQIHTRPDSAANYQFIIDAFRKDSTKVKTDTVAADSTKKKEKLTLNLNKLTLSHVDVTFNDQGYHLEELLYKRKGSQQTATISDLQRSWVSHTKKGDVDNRLTVGNLILWDDGSSQRAEVVDLHFLTDNHLPRKNTGKPKRGFFDAGHFDVSANLKADITSIRKDSIVAAITQCSAVDRGSGLTVKSLTTKVLVANGVAHLSDVDIRLQQSQLKFAKATVQLPSKKQQRALAFSTSPITGRVILQDIARPFAPVLSKFTIPLSLRTTFSGNAEELRFDHVSVGTTDKLLAVSAQGSITGLKDKHQLAVRFHVNKMTARQNIPERIINQFPVKKFMMKQLGRLGTIYYTGDFSVLYKKEVFQGQLTTAAGALDFNFALDELNKYVFGTARTSAFQLGQVMDMPDIGTIACKADFRFDISKPRTALMRRKKGGKLPIGSVDAEVYEAAYKKIKVRNVVAHLVSDGAVADGNIEVKGGRVDMLCSFSFTNTNEMRKTKIKPGIRFHKLSDEKRAAKEERKAAKKAAKEQERAAKAEERAAKRAAKEEQKAAKQAAKEQERAAKRAAKEERKAAKAAAKEAKRAAREAAKSSE